MVEELKTLKDFEPDKVTAWFDRESVDDKRKTFAYWLSCKDIRAKAILQVKRIRKNISQIGHNHWCPSFYGEKDGVQRFDTLKTIERYIMWQNNLTEDDLK